jgi:hypothetical protein
LKIHSVKLAIYLCVAVLLAGCGGGHRKTITVAIEGASATIAPNGTFTLTATVTNDSSGDGVTWTLNGAGALSATSSTATTYTAPSSVPTNPSVSITATSVADTTASQTVTFTIQSSISTTACGPNPVARGSEGALDGVSVAFLVKGADANDAPIAYAGSVTFNGGTAQFLAGSMDVVGYATGETGLQLIDLTGSSYSYGSDGRGCLYLQYNPADVRAKHPLTARNIFHRASLPSGRAHKAIPNRAAAGRKLTPSSADAGAIVFSFVLLNTASGPGRIEEFDNTTGSGIVASGQMAVQDSDAFSTEGLASQFAFGADGWAGDPEDGGIHRVAAAGNFQNDGEGHLTNGTADENNGGAVNFGNGTADPLQGGAGLYQTTVDGTTGRGIGSYSASNNEDDLEYDFAFYIINDQDAFIISTDDPTQSFYMLSGRWLAAASPNDSVDLAGNYLNSINGLSATTFENNYVSIATLNVDDGSATGTSYVNDAGTYTSGAFDGTESFNATFGRVNNSNALSNEVGYVTATADEDEIAAFTIGTDGNAGSGYLFTQAATTYNNASLTGNWAWGTAEDVDGITGSEVGVFVFDGNGGYTVTGDVISVGGPYAPDHTGSGTYAVNGDGSGSFNDGAVALVTNGSLTLAIDESDTVNGQPFLYFFLQGPTEDARAKAKAKANAKTTVKAASTATSGSTSGFLAKPKSNYSAPALSSRLIAKTAPESRIAPPGPFCISAQCGVDFVTARLTL